MNAIESVFGQRRLDWDLALAKRFAWLLRADVRAGRSALETPPKSFEQWWLVQGRSEYPYWSYLSLEQKKSLFEAVGKLPVGKLELAIPKMMQLVLSRRADVIQKFSAEQKVNALAVAAWFWMMGINEHLLTSAVELEWIRQLDRPVLVDPAADPKPVMETPSPSVLMQLAWNLLSAPMQQQMALERSDSRYRYFCWFFTVGVNLFHCYAMIANRWRLWLLQELPVHVQKPELGQLPRFAHIEYAMTEAAKRPDLSQTKQVEQLRAWAQLALLPASTAAVEQGVANPQATDGSAQSKAVAKTAMQAPGKWAWLKQKSVYEDNGFPKEQLRIWQPAVVNQSPHTIVGHSLPPIEQKPFGVNLFGFAYGELGIGEDLRMAVAVCQAAKIPFKIINISPGKETRQADRSMESQVAHGPLDLTYGINVFCMPLFDIVGRVFLKYGEWVFRHHYNIGWAPWELGVWPRAWIDAFDLVDEVWACSQFSEQMYQRFSTKPVWPMPLATSIARLKPHSRKHFGLPAKAFLFLYVFDFNSSLERKNPQSAISAFQAAFPRKADVRLVLKVMNPKAKDPQWLALEKAAKADPRIILLTQTLERSEVLGLIQICDAYVSPHRAEGFGRTLTEAMLMGKPVVATNYSGNQFFMEPSLTFPVNYTLVPVIPGQYYFVEDGDAAQWANPDLSHLAAQLKAALAFSKHPNSAKKIRAYAQAVFAPERTADLMLERLNQIIRQWRQSESTAHTDSATLAKT